MECPPSPDPEPLVEPKMPPLDPDPGANAEFHTCSDGLVFNPNIGQCVPQANYPQCQPEKPPMCDPTCECLYPSESCSEYYKCNTDGIPIKKECLGGLHFNDETHSCDYPENVGCSERRKRTFKSQVTKENHFIKPEDCSYLKGVFALEGDVSSYYLCSHGNAFMLRCPDKAVFSGIHGKCILRK
ncbi:peritrophin-1-like [Macrobrachium nipponense]|uniref:peritrophin-1-like n=1 Tax=Macrobrachium nipponense TaxID=159736 RepID=UPI0030C8CDF2